MSSKKKVVFKHSPNKKFFKTVSELTSPAAKVPAIAEPTAEVTSLLRTVQQLKEVVETREGQRGPALDSSVTWRELFGNGVVDFNLGDAVYTSGEHSFVARPPERDMTIPPPPANMKATGALANIIIEWDAPGYGNHAHAEIWRHDADIIGNATLVGTTQANIYVDNVGAGGAFYYWVRFVSNAAVPGPYNAVAGVRGETGKDPAYVMELLLGKLGYDQFDAANGVFPVRTVTALPVLPDTKYPAGVLVYLTSDGKLYRNKAGTWTAEVAASDMTGQIEGSQIAPAAVSLTKFATGIEPVGVVDALPAVSGYTGPKTVLLTTDYKLYRYTGTAWVSAVPAADVTGQLTDAQLSAISAAKVSGQLTDAQLSAISAAKITGQVASSQIADAAVTFSKFSGGLQPVSIVDALPAVTGYAGPKTVMLTTDYKLYRYTGTAWVASIPAADITGQITETQITDTAISTPKLAAGAVTTAKVAAGAITANEIAANAVTAGKISAGAIAADHISSGAVVTAKLAAGAVTANEIAAGAVTTTKVAAGAITAGEIAAGAITTPKLAAGAVTANELAAGSVVTAKLAAGAVTATELAAGAVTTNKLAAGAVTANEIAANAVTTGKVAAGAISADQIAAGAIATKHLLVADMTNIITNPSLGTTGPNPTPSTDGWIGVVSAVLATDTGVPAGAPSKTVARQTGRDAYFDRWVDVKPGETFGLSVDYVNADSTHAWGIGWEVFKADGTRLGWYITQRAPTSSTWTSYSYIFTMPAGAARARPWVQISAVDTFGNWYWCNLRYRKAADSTLVVDGAITAAKIAAGSIDADKLAANAITAGKIAAGAIVAGDGVISNLAIGTAHIIDGTITNAKIGNLAVDDAKIANLSAAKINAGFLDAARIDVGSLDAKIANIDAAKITSGFIDNARITNLTAGNIDATTFKSDNALTRELTVRDAAGNIILSSGVGIRGAYIEAGTGGNYLHNGDIQAGISGYAKGGNDTTLTVTLRRNINTIYSLRGEGLGSASLTGTPAAGTRFDIHTENVGDSAYWPCEPGKRYEAHVLLATHNCESEVAISFRDSANAILAIVTGNRVRHAQGVSTPADMRQSHVFATAPANATHMHLAIRTFPDALADPAVYFGRVYLGQAHAGQTEPTPFSNGSGIRQITKANASTFIETASIKNAFIDTLDAGKITTGFLSAGRINTNTINAGMIISKSCTSFQYNYFASGNDTWNYIDFDMDHSGTATVTVNCTYTFSGTGDGSAELRGNIDNGGDAVHFGSWGTSIVRHGRIVLHRSSLASGTHRINFKAVHSFANGNHNIHINIFRSYR